MRVIMEEKTEPTHEQIRMFRLLVELRRPKQEIDDMIDLLNDKGCKELSDRVETLMKEKGRGLTEIEMGNIEAMVLMDDSNCEEEEDDENDEEDEDA